MINSYNKVNENELPLHRNACEWHQMDNFIQLNQIEIQLKQLIIENNGLRYKKKH